MVPARRAGGWWVGLAVLGLLAGPAAHARAAPRPATAQVADPSLGPAVRAPTAAAATSSADDPVSRVVAISVDGLNPNAIRTLGASGAPNFHRLIREGAVTLNARTAREQTRTLPNHTSMLTGRRIDARSGGHGITMNSDTGTTVHRAADCRSWSGVLGSPRAVTSTR